MALIDHDAGLAKAGANVHGWAGGLLFFVRRYPLGAIGAVIMGDAPVFAADPDPESRPVPLATPALSPNAMRHLAGR